MARYTGKDGIVDVDGNAVAQVTGWVLDVVAPLQEANVCGQGYVGHDTGAPRVTGTINCLHDPADLTGQALMTIGAKVALKLQSQGVGSGLPQFSIASAVISGTPVNLEADPHVTREYSFGADAALDETAQV